MSGVLGILVVGTTKQSLFKNHDLTYLNTIINNTHNFAYGLKIYNYLNKKDVTVDSPKNIVTVIHYYNEMNNDIMLDIEKNINIYSNMFINANTIFVINNININLSSKPNILIVYNNMTDDTINNISTFINTTVKKYYMNNTFLIYDNPSPDPHVASQAVPKGGFPDNARSSPEAHRDRAHLQNCDNINYDKTMINLCSVINKMRSEYTSSMILYYFMLEILKKKLVPYFSKYLLVNNGEFYKKYISSEYLCDSIINEFVYILLFHYYNTRTNENEIIMAYNYLFVPRNIEHIYYSSLCNNIKLLVDETLGIRYKTFICVNYKEYYNNTYMLKLFIELNKKNIVPFEIQFNL